MKIREVEVGDQRFTVKTIGWKQYYQLLELFRVTENWVAHSQNLILHSLSDWNLTGPDGAKLPITKETIEENLGADAVEPLRVAVEEVNNLGAAEKKASSGAPVGV